MRLQDMKHTIPETPEFIHEMILSEVAKQLHTSKTVPISNTKHRKWTRSKVAAAAVICVLAASSLVYAGTALYKMAIEQQGSYQVTTKIQGNSVGTSVSDNTSNCIPDMIPEITLSTDYIPEGMEWNGDCYLNYPETPLIGGISFASDFLGDGSLDTVIKDYNVIESEEKTFGEYEGVYVKFHELSDEVTFNQRIYLLCPDIYRMVTLAIGSDVSKEDAIQVADHLIITKTGNMIPAQDLITINDRTDSSGSDYSYIDSIEDTQLQIHPIGDSLSIDPNWASTEDVDGNYISAENFSVRVDSVQLADDLHLLDSAHLPEEWNDVLDENGLLKKNTLSYIKSGDGIDTLDEVVKTETVNQKLLYATVTYTNNSSVEWKHTRYLGSLVFLNHATGSYELYLSETQRGNGYDKRLGDGVARAMEMRYFDVSEDYGNGRNSLPSLKPGESIQVHMAWIINETDLPNLYLNLSNDGAFMELTDAMLYTGLVAILP